MLVNVNGALPLSHGLAEYFISSEQRRWFSTEGN